MSADNMICIQKRKDGFWWVWMGFASDDEYKTGPDKERDKKFESRELAVMYAQGWYRGEMWCEYGVIMLEPEEGER